MNAKHALPIRVQSMKELESRLHTEGKHADIVEIWLDSIEDLRLAEIFFEKKELNKPFLFVNKAAFEGGSFMGTEQDRIGVLCEMFERGAEYVDVAVQTPEKLIQELNTKKPKSSKLILSYHDFKKTPSTAALKRIVRGAVKKGADIVKIATFINKMGESVRLFEITQWAADEGIEVITMGMGEEGRLTRIICPLIGSSIYYAPLEEDFKTAPGQLTRGELQMVWEAMGLD